MSNYHYKRTVKALHKELSNTAKFMTDMEAFFNKQWKDGAGINKEAKEYVGQQQLDTLIKGFGQMTSLVGILVGRVDQLENMQVKQSIDVAKVRNAKARVRKITEGAHSLVQSIPTQPVEEVKMFVVMYDRKEYLTKTGKVRWSTPGFLARDIAFNEFDIAMNRGDFDVFDTRQIKPRWPFLAQQCKTLTGMSLGQLLTIYAKARGLTKPAKRGRPRKERE